MRLIDRIRERLRQAILNGWVFMAEHPAIVVALYAARWT